MHRDVKACMSGCCSTCDAEEEEKEEKEEEEEPFEKLLLVFASMTPIL